ncbi:ATP-binding cassette domain-containing protein [Streptococcus pneumoniae]
MFFTSHLKRYINRYEKATFFALKTSHTNNLRVTSLAGNSYPYYQGEILLDHLPVHQLWGKFGMILQQEHTFISSYENNVTIFKTFEANFRDEKFEKIPPQSLSGGQQQHMYLNREKNRHSPLIIMDEPFSALDASQFQKELDKVLSLSSAVVLTLHRQEEMLSRFDQIWEIKDGELVIVKRVLKHD